MTQAQDNEDAQWLAALAGQPDATADIVTNMQADALRRALQAQSARLESAVPAADDAQYQQLLFRLRREGLAGNNGAWANVVQWGRTKGQAASRAMASHNTLSWGVAATAVLVVGVAVQMSLLHQGQDDPHGPDTLRGGQGTVLIVPNPTVRAAELLAGLKAAGAEPALTQGSDGGVQLRVKSSGPVLEYLDSQRLDTVKPDKDGIITLTLTLPQKKP